VALCTGEYYHCVQQCVRFAASQTDTRVYAEASSAASAAIVASLRNLVVAVLIAHLGDTMTAIDRQKSAEMEATLDPYHTLVGRIASQWAYLDHMIDQAIWKLAEAQPALGACITTQLVSTPARLRVLVALLFLREGSEIVPSMIRGRFLMME
jgi:hypothetical protein